MRLMSLGTAAAVLSVLALAAAPVQAAHKSKHPAHHGTKASRHAKKAAHPKKATKKQARAAHHTHQV